MSCLLFFHEYDIIARGQSVQNRILVLKKCKHCNKKKAEFVTAHDTCGVNVDWAEHVLMMPLDGVTK